MRLPLFAKDTSLFELLDAQAEAAHRGAAAFHAIALSWERRAEHVAAIASIEQEADELTHQLANKVDSMFVTPLDKEDLRTLSGALDDVIDTIEAATERIMLYQIPCPRPDLEPLLGILVKLTEATHHAVRCLRTLSRRDERNERLIRVHDLENQTDHAYRRSLAELFNAPDANPLLVMKWKEIYDRIEISADRCEDVAKVIESVAVKYA
ncbi:MAG: DUF47 family protein [Chthonomonadales bacterium]|nr:DUF47 family protein [Chthonomonadales bacterium]